MSKIENLKKTCENFKILLMFINIQQFLQLTSLNKL